MDARALGPVVGVALCVLLTVVAATVVGVTVLDVAPAGDGPPRASLEGSADAARDRIAVTHRGGDALDVSAVRLRVTIDGEALAHQPPVPFFAARGFEAGPTGPFNAGGDTRWQAGETAAVRLAGTNSPPLSPGSRVVVDVYVDDHRIAHLETRAT